MLNTPFLRSLLLGLFIFGSLYIAIFVTSCWPAEEQVLTEVEIDLSDTLFQRIYDFQDKGLSDSLYQFFGERDPSYRYIAALAFSAIQDPGSMDTLRILLNDPVERVRAAAAYSLGQIGDEKAVPSLIRAFNPADTAGTQIGNSAILAAIGKLGNVERLQQISEVTTYEKRDSQLLIGQAEAIYHFGLRKIHHPSGIAQAVKLAIDPGYPHLARLFAASYLGRSKDIQLDTFARRLTDGFIAEKDPDIRSALALSLGNTQDSLTLLRMKSRFSNEADYRVRINLLRAMSRFPYPLVQETLIGALTDANHKVSVTAAELLRDNGSPEDATFYWRLAKDSLSSRTQITLYAAANRHLPAYFADFRGAINYELRQRYKTSGDAYEQANVLNALGEYPWNYRFLYQEAIQTESPVLRSAATEALANINGRDDFEAFFSTSRSRVRNELGSMFTDLINRGDVGAIYHAANALLVKDRAYRQVIDSLKFLQQARDKLQLPRDVEADYALRDAQLFLAGKEVTPHDRPAWNHPINWEMLSTFQSRPTARILTEKGIILLELMPDLAPATVANFIELSRDGYYDGKLIHRVVPNFVAQGGGPRGDGFGSLNYTIRTEVPPIYYDQEGLVGMASAGLHTESVQFFITYSPALHLSGKYTIFAKVIEGMDLAHQLKVGDRIRQITIRDL